MYAKVSGTTVLQFPYTIGELRKDHPNVSFPKSINSATLARYGVVGVVQGPQPTEVGTYQKVTRNSQPDYDSDTGVWMINYTVSDMFADTTDDEGNVTTKAEHEAAYQATLDEQAATRVRAERDRLIAETDWWASSDLTMTDEQTAYRQALRDITSHANFPYLEEADWPTKP
jgi:hypothetical protein